MKTNLEKISTENENLIYEPPSLKKYGTMKDLTLGAGGSSSDLVAQACTTSCTVAGKPNNSGNTIDAPALQDPIKMDDNKNALV